MLKKKEDKQIYKGGLQKSTIAAIIVLPLVGLAVLYVFFFTNTTYMLKNGLSENHDLGNGDFKDILAKVGPNKNEATTVDVDKEFGLEGMDENEVIQLIKYDIETSDEDDLMNLPVFGDDVEVGSSVSIIARIIRFVRPDFSKDDKNNENFIIQFLNFFWDMILNAFVNPYNFTEFTSVASDSYIDVQNDILIDDYDASDWRYYKNDRNISSDEYPETITYASNSPSINNSQSLLPSTNHVNDYSTTLDSEDILLRTDDHPRNFIESLLSQNPKTVNLDVSSEDTTIKNEVEYFSTSFNKLVDLLNNDIYLRRISYKYMDFNIPNTFICPDSGKDISLLIGIITRIRDYDLRKSIRLTWANGPKLEGVKYVFVIGSGLTPEIDTRLKHESDYYGDIVQSHVMDIKDNKEAHAVMFLKWVDMFCPETRFVAKVDNNVFLNVPQLYQLVLDNEFDEDSMYGNMFENQIPVRDPNNITEYVPKDLYPLDIYPKFLGKSAYLFHRKFAKMIYDVAEYFPYFPKENILITGIIAEKLGIKRIDVSKYFLSFPEKMKNAPEDLCSTLPICVVYDMTSENMIDLWDLLKSKSYKCFNFFQSYKNILQVSDKYLYNSKNNKLIYPAITGDKHLYI